MRIVSEPIFESITSMETAEFESWAHARAAWDANHYELLQGRVVVMPPAGFPHGRIELRLGARLFAAAEAIGAQAFGSSQGFVFPSGDVLEPDLTVVAADRWSAVTPVAGEFLRVVPDLVVEVLSPSTAHRDRGEKKLVYARSGVREYWLVDSRARAITVYRGDGESFDRGVVLVEGDILGSIVLDGFACPVRDVF